MVVAGSDPEVGDGNTPYSGQLGRGRVIDDCELTHVRRRVARGGGEI